MKTMLLMRHPNRLAGHPNFKRMTVAEKKAFFGQMRYSMECQLFGEDQARINRLPKAEFLAWIDQAQREADTPSDLVWPAEGYTGPQLP